MLVAALVLLPLGAMAQEAAPTPPPDPHTYSDDAMTFIAPAEYRPMGQRKIPVTELGDSPQVVAAWILPDGERTKRLLLQQQLFEGPLDNFVSSYKETLRGAYDNIHIKGDDPISLKNGMPARYMEGTTGEGFDATKIFSIVWIDGLRGVALTVIAPVGEMDKATAMKVMSNASAVRYPYRP